MNRDGSITLDWADGTHTFALKWGEFAKLQEATDCGPQFLLGKLYDGTWRVEHLSHVIRCGLIGGGQEPAKALQLVRSYVEDRPPMESVKLAQAILAAGLVGAPEEEVGKKAKAPNAESGSTDSPTGGSGSEPSTEPAEA